MKREREVTRETGMKGERERGDKGVEGRRKRERVDGSRSSC